MSVRAQLLSFLRQPKRFAQSPADGPIWLDGLDFARRSIENGKDYELRPAQVTAWRGLAEARAGLVLGPPGTGKTHLLSWLILGYVYARRNAGLPCRVFLSAFTLNAVGNLLEAVARRRDEHWTDGPEVQYFGRAPANGLAQAIHHTPRVDGRRADDAINALMSTDQVVVGGSIWSLYRLLQSGSGPAADGLTAEIFDLVCIDEASQMVLGHGLMTLGGLKQGGRLVVAGDDRQLAPVRASREIALGDRQLGGSLYTFLKSAQVPEFALDETFRLNGPLAAFPERKFYPGRYRSAVEANALLLKPGWEEGLQDWERTALDPQWPICVLLHDGPPAATENSLEADLSVRLAKLLIDRLPRGCSADGIPVTDLWTEQLAIISPHRAQNVLIRGFLPTGLRQNSFVETVDRIQGKERDTVILSYTVADAEFALAEGEFIFSPERLNVAITRSRTKLIVLISRRLLEAVPSDQEVMDKAELLREFVFSCTRAGEIPYRARDGRDVSIQIRVLGFHEDQPLQEITLEARTADNPQRELTQHLLNVLSAVKSTALGNQSGEATINRLKQVLARGPDLLGDLAALHVLGCVSLKKKRSQHGEYWSAKPLEPRRQVFGVDHAAVKSRLEEVIAQMRRGSFAPFYEDVRDRFAWPAHDGKDVLDPVVERLKDEGLVQLNTWRDRLTVDWTGAEDTSLSESSEAKVTEIDSDEDFELLNELEQIEASRINFGIFEAWTSSATLADKTRRNRQEVLAALGRLSAAGWVMLAEEGRVRSRMAELAREIRYVKQRFQREDAGKRPYLVRSLKVELRDRDKPERTNPLANAIEGLAGSLKDNIHHAAALRGLSGALHRLWGTDAKIAGFQSRGLEVITRAWNGEGSNTYVVAADTGSGKTEAVVLPLIVGAAAERLKGNLGVKAILTYPRVRLAANQAQRLASYLAAFSAEPGMPEVTLGLQVGQVPETFERLHERDIKAGWASSGDRQFFFPFFSCPRATCGGDLLLKQDDGRSGADRLVCTRCDWQYAGWIGSKSKLRENPPDLFLPTTDSLHQWLHDARYGALFGDRAAFAPPRAILADEIHLYSHIHGAQVGFSLRRLAARAELNSSGDSRLLAIGMSATLGDPAMAWGRLMGRTDVATIQPASSEKVGSARGREYFYFVQPEVESRGQDIAGASTTIQTLMCLAHGMRRRTGREGGFRSLVFLDSIDKMRRLHAAYTDAEEVKRLSSYRTYKFFDEDTGDLRDGCCNEPFGCDGFRNGECWWFAAKDEGQLSARGRRRASQSLKVCEQPIFSGATGRVEALIKDSDIVFSTSSLEVGYDDPNIALVYQHYAPHNLASFIQRKGRGGRGSDDRPITGVTLSIYSSRDSWWFRKPHEMIEPIGFESPLNPDNHFVRRAQILAATLDGLVRYQGRTGELINPIAPSGAALADAEVLVCKVFGSEPWREFEELPSLRALWDRAIGRASKSVESLSDVRGSVDWIPNFLHETINLPQLIVDTGLEDNQRREDIALALNTSAPGNATRRYDQVHVLWRPPQQGRAPWFAEEDYQNGQRPTPFGQDTDQLLARLPLEARPLLGGLSPEIFRPRSMRLETVGRIYGTGWQSDWIVTQDALPTCQRQTTPSQSPRAVNHDSRSSLRGFPIIKATPDRARPLKLSGLKSWFEKAEWFAGDSLGGRETGLAMARVYWGSDAEVRLVGAKEESAVFSQVFTDISGQAPMLHGYHVQTEGVRFTLNRSRLDDLVAREVSRFQSDDSTRRWHAGQMLRFLIEAGAKGAGVNEYEARRGAELMVSAAGHPVLRKDLSKLLKFWSGEDLAQLFEATRSTLLSQHPLLSQRRVARVAETLSDLRFREIFERAVLAAGDAHQFSQYLKSVIVHSVATRLRSSFLHIGRGNDHQVVMHVELPLQFGGDHDCTITICESGSFGDGTTRTFVDSIQEFIEHWENGFISQCPNALEDAAVRRFFEASTFHEQWRSLDPNDPAALAQLRAPLQLAADAAIPSSIFRILFGTEAVGIERFAIYDLAESLQRTGEDLTVQLRRAPTAWELTSAAVATARTDANSIAGRLLGAYEALEDAAQDDSLNPEVRLADQMFRVHARLCVDGCQACVHQSSDMMSDTLVEASTSRRLLCEFVEN